MPDEKLEQKVIEVSSSGLSQTWQNFKKQYCPVCESTAMQF